MPLNEQFRCKSTAFGFAYVEDGDLRALLCIPSTLTRPMLSTPPLTMTDLLARRFMELSLQIFFYNSPELPLMALPVFIEDRSVGAGHHSGL